MKQEGLLLAIAFTLSKVAAQSLGSLCQTNADCSGYTNPCCGYPTASAALGAVQFVCGSTGSTTTFTCIPDASDFITNCPLTLPVKCRLDTAKLGSCGTQDMFNKITIQSGGLPSGMQCTGLTGCTECIKSSKKMCYLGEQFSTCCTGNECLPAGKTQGFCSDLAQSYSMRFTFCTYDTQACMASDALLPASVMTARQYMLTPASKFNQAKYCYWMIQPPSEFTADLVVKVKIDRLYGTECYLNFGGSITTAGQETSCIEGTEYSFAFQSLGQVSNIYLVALATTNSAHIKFSYWAEPRFALHWIILIMGGSILILSLLIMAVFLFIIDCSAGQALTEAVNSVKSTFTATIDEIEPGKIANSFPDDSSNTQLQGPAESHLSPDKYYDDMNRY